MSQDFMASISRLDGAAKTVRAYAHGDANKALVNLLNELAHSYRGEVTHITAAELPGLQAKVLQLEALCSVLSGVEINGRI